MSGDHPHPHSTLIRSNDRFISTSISLGDLMFIRAYSSWHDRESLFEVRFRHGSADMNAATLTDLVRQGQEALVAARVDGVAS